MRWELWEPKYKEIVKRLILDEHADMHAAELLEKILPELDIEDLKNIINGKECIIFGAGPSLDKDLAGLNKSRYLDKVVIAVDGATSAVLNYYSPDIIVTDLDGAVERQYEAWNGGSWLVVHGHGDNDTQIRKFVPIVDARIIGTTQVKPFGKLFNFGGFTDGDRAAFMAYELGAKKIFLAGMDLGTEVGKHSGMKDTKRKLIKLDICKELLSWLSAKLGAKIVNLTSGGESIPNVPRQVP